MFSVGKKLQNKIGVRSGKYIDIDRVFVGEGIPHDLPGIMGCVWNSLQKH